MPNLLLGLQGASGVLDGQGGVKPLGHVVS